MEKFTVYALMQFGIVKYIGATKNLKTRVYQHRRDGKIFDDYITLVTTESKHEANILESSYIKKFITCHADKGGYNVGSTKNVKATCMESGEVYIYPTILDAADDLGLSSMSMMSDACRSNINSHRSHKGSNVYCGYKWTYTDEKSDDIILVSLV